MTMSDSKNNIFVPEYVPLENKGEEAIICGMADVIYPDSASTFVILDTKLNKIINEDHFVRYPNKWFYPSWRRQEFTISVQPAAVWSSICSLIRNVLNRIIPMWVLWEPFPNRYNRFILKSTWFKNKVRRKALEEVLKCGYLIAGHDGAFDEYDCHVINLMHEFGMRYGIFGSSMKTKTKSKYIISVFEKTLQNADFIYCRDRIAFDWAKNKFKHLNIQLAPDPAFGMRPASQNDVDEMIEREGLIRLFTKPVIMVTCAEPAPIERHSFKNIPLRKKKNVHRDFLASIFDYIVNKHDAHILFIPHAIGPTPGLDDRKIANDVIRRMQRFDMATNLVGDFSGRILKGLVSRADLLIGERIHSIIGAFGVNTPFISMGVEQDNRVMGIIGEMCECHDLIYLLNDANQASFETFFDNVWSAKTTLKERLSKTSMIINGRLATVGNEIKDIIRGKEID